MDKNIFKIAGVAIIGFLLLGLFIGQTQIEFRKFFGTQSADVEREIFEESQSYVHGKRQEANRMFVQYNRAETESERKLIKSMIPHQFANFDEDRHLTGEIRQFIKEGKAGR